MTDDQRHRDDAAQRSQDWSDYRRYVIQELERINKVIVSISDKVDKLRVEDLSALKTDLALLKFQAGVWGAGGGILFGAIVTAILRLWVK